MRFCVALSGLCRFQKRFGSSLGQVIGGSVWLSFRAKGQSRDSGLDRQARMGFETF